jgi:hypothetical protein
MGRASHNNHPFLDLLPQPYTHLPFLLQQRSRTKPENPWTKKFYWETDNGLGSTPAPSRHRF